MSDSAMHSSASSPPKGETEKRATYAAEEIDLPDLINSIWRTRKLVLAFIVVAALVMAGGLALLRAGIPSYQVFQTGISFSFPESQENKYPNGAQFSPRQIIASNVLAKVYAENSLKDHGIALDEFVSAVSVHSFETTYDEVYARYRRRLADKAITFVESQTIEEAMRDELSSLGKKKVILRLQLRRRVGISETLGRELLHDIVATWARISVEQHGVLKLPLGLERIDLVDPKLSKSLDFPIAIDLFLIAIKRIKKRIEELSAFGGAETLIDAESGHTLHSLQRVVNDLEEFNLRELSALVFEYGITRDPEWTRIYFLRRIDRLKLEKSGLFEKAKAVAEALEGYSQKSQNPILSGSGTTETPPPVANVGTTIPQFGDAFIDRIIGLAEQGSDQAFRESMTREQIDYRKKSIEIDIVVRNTQSLLDKLQKNRTQEERVEQLTFKAAEKRLKDQFPQVVTQLNEFWKIVGRIYEQLGSQRSSYGDHLYVELDLPKSKQVIVSHPVFNMRILVIFLAGLASAAVFAVLFGLLWQVIRRRAS